ncbi:MAG: 30S ribosomal protein S6 [Spirochaetota bacterium]
MILYEGVFIFSTKEDKFVKGKELVASEFNRIKAVIQKEEDMGDKDLAYPIKKENRGHYYYYEVEQSPEKLLEIEKNFKLSPEILKYLFVKKISRSR